MAGELCRSVMAAKGKRVPVTHLGRRRRRGRSTLLHNHLHRRTIL